MEERSDISFSVGPKRAGDREESCICPNCGYEMKRPPEVPCYALKCPRCGAPMSGV